MLNLAPFLDAESGTLWLAKQLAEGDDFSVKSMYCLNVLTSLYQNGNESIYQRTPREGHRGCHQGGRRNVQASIILRGSAAAGLCSSREEQPSGYTREQEIIGLWAEKDGCWHDYADSYLKSQGLRNLGLNGSESNVYYNTSDACVYKIIDGRHYSCDLTRLVDRITVFNSYFPEAGLKVLGFGMKDDVEDLTGFSVIVSQPYVFGNETNNQGLYDDIIQNRNLYAKGSGLTGSLYFYNHSESMRFYDLHDLNAVKTEQGRTVVFDCDCSIYEGSGYRIPPVSGSEHSVKAIGAELERIVPGMLSLSQVQGIVNPAEARRLDEMQEGDIMPVHISNGICLAQRHDTSLLVSYSQVVYDLLTVQFPQLPELYRREVALNGKATLGDGNVFRMDLSTGVARKSCDMTQKQQLKL